MSSSSPLSLEGRREGIRIVAIIWHINLPFEGLCKSQIMIWKKQMVLPLTHFNAVNRI